METHNARIEKVSIKIDTQKRNDQLLSLEPEKSSLESMHPKINLVYTNVLRSSKLGFGWVEQNASGTCDKVSITF